MDLSFNPVTYSLGVAELLSQGCTVDALARYTSEGRRMAVTISKDGQVAQAVNAESLVALVEAYQMLTNLLANQAAPEAAPDTVPLVTGPVEVAEPVEPTEIDKATEVDETGEPATEEVAEPATEDND